MTMPLSGICANAAPAMDNEASNAKEIFFMIEVLMLIRYACCPPTNQLTARARIIHHELCAGIALSGYMTLLDSSLS